MLAIITGAGRGIGKAISIRLNQLGYDLILIARSLNELQKLQEELLLANSNRNVNIIPIDLSKIENRENVCREIQTLEVDVIVNNVGIYHPDNAAKIELDHLIATLQVNLFTAIQLTNCLLPQMKKAKKGHIFNICSVAAIQALKDAASYSISKAALKSWSDALRDEVRKDLIKLTAIYPASVYTSSWDERSVDTGKMIQTGDISNIVEMCLKISQYANCEEIHINSLGLPYGKE